MIDGVIALYIFMLAAFTGYEVISRVPVILHTPLMSGSNFVHGIVLVGAMVALASADSTLLRVIGVIGVILAAGNACGFLFIARDDDGNGAFDFGVQRDRHFVLTDRLDRCIERDLTAIDPEAGIADEGNEIARRYRTEQLTRLRSLPQHGEALAVELSRDLRSLGLKRERARFEIAFHCFIAAAVLGRGPQCLAARQQEVPGKAVLHAHDVAHLAEPADTFE